MIRRRTAATLAVVGALAASVVPPATAGADVVVCNEAQSSWQGTWDATTSLDSVPPAFHKDAAMAVGPGTGLVNAAGNSPSLAVCVPADDDGGGDTIT